MNNGAIAAVVRCLDGSAFSLAAKEKERIIAVREKACAAIAAMGRVPGIKHKLMQSGALESIVRALKAHRSVHAHKATGMCMRACA